MSRYGLESPAEFFLREAGVAMTAGGQFGTGAGSFARFNFATDEDLIVEMVERMSDALADSCPPQL